MGSAGARSPTSQGSQVLLRNSDFSLPLPPRFVAFAWRYRRCAQVSFLPRTRAQRPWAGAWSPGCPIRISRRRKRDLPGSSEDPCVHAPLMDPGGTFAHGISERRYCLPPYARRRLPLQCYLSGLYHTACTFPVYASQPGSPPVHATLGTGWWPASPGRICTCWVPSKGFRLYLT